jgi:hypothetical protein
MQLGRYKEKQEILKLVGAHQLLVYADDMNLLGHNIDTIKQIIRPFLSGVSKEDGIEAVKTKCTLLVHHHNER